MKFLIILATLAVLAAPALGKIWAKGVAEELFPRPRHIWALASILLLARPPMCGNIEASGGLVG
jgi:hypothetical protein